MIDQITFWSKILTATLPFVLLCLQSEKVNLPKSDRSRQFAMPIVAILYSIACMLLLDNINSWLIDLLNNIPVWIRSLASFSWMPSFIGNILGFVSLWIENLISSLNLKYWIFYISNFAIIAVYLLLKKIVIAVIDKTVKHSGAVHTRIASVFYRFFFERSLWVLKDGYAQVRSMLQTLYFVAVVISSSLLIISAEMYRNDMLQAVFYPVFGVLLLGELWFYLGGLTQNEYSTIIGEDDETYKVVNYSLLRRFLRTLFKDKVLTENTDLNSPLTYGVTTDDILNTLEKSEDPKINCLAAYFKVLNKTGFAIDHNYLQSTVDLLNEKSILFNNPFYKDMIPYAFYPMNRALLSHKKVLIVLGRHAVEADVREWLENGISSITNIPFLWNIEELSDALPDTIPDIGIVSRSNVLNVKMHDVNEEFLKQVGFVVILEPSRLITTAQIGLNLLIKKCESPENKPVYCMCDKNCDGLVDAMSHILMTNITEVSATKKHSGTSSYMCWDADNTFMQHRMLPNISRYLGFGTELSFAALKNQVACTEWYGGDAFPVTDMHWIAKQYYFDLTKYAGLPTNQESMSEYFKTSPNFWSASVSDRNYFTVEDEAFNMFEILRNFSTRTTKQGFINVVSQEYLLREYMAENASIFETDAKAIPYIAADHARTKRNILFKLLLLMSSRPVGANVIEKEFSLLGIQVYNLTAQLWFEIYKCFATAEDLAEINGMKYEDAVIFAARKRIVRPTFDVDRTLLIVKNGYDIELSRMQEVYSINDKPFIDNCIAELRSVSYIAEDEQGQKNFLGAEVKGHISQKYLPGQFFTFGGKYYEMQYVTPDNQVLLRRAADHITGRASYRQIRDYCLNGIRPSDEIGAVRDISGMRVVRELADYDVNTEGYYSLDRYNNFSSAKKITFAGNGIPTRRYYNKQVLRIDLPESGNDSGDRIRYTITVLFNEIFRTLFAENHAYICAVTDNSFVDENDTNPLTYSLSSNGCNIGKSSIYIIEDSQLDLGLLIAVERNLNRIFEIMYEYLDWHGKTLADSLATKTDTDDGVGFGPTPTKSGVVSRIIDRIKKLFKRKPKKGDEPKDEPTGEPKDDTPMQTPDDSKTEKPKKKKSFWEWLKSLFKRKPKGEPTEPTDGAETPADEPAEPTDADGSDGQTAATSDAPPKKKKGLFGWVKSIFKRKGE